MNEPKMYNSKPPFEPSRNCFILIEHYEGRHSDAYLCPSGIPTIGVGHTKNVKIGDKAGFDQVNQWLKEDTNICKYLINDLKLQLNQNMFDAICSFVFNLGIGNFKSSTLYKKIKVNPHDISIYDEFLRWNKATVNGKLMELKGLTSRRKSEAELYFTGKLLLL